MIYKSFNLNLSTVFISNVFCSLYFLYSLRKETIGSVIVSLVVEQTLDPAQKYGDQSSSLLN